MKLLDYDIFPAFLEHWFGSPDQKQERLVGSNREYDSGYFDIVRFFGPDAIDPGTVAIRYDERPVRLEDPVIAAYARRTEKELRAQGRLFEGPPTMAVVEENFNAGEPFCRVQPCDYGLFAGSCFALDRRAPEFEGRGGTLREYYAAAYPDRTSDRHPLAGSLGVCGLLVVRGADGSPKSILLVERAGHLASLENSTGPSAAGSVDWDISCRTLRDLAISSLAAEVREELGLARDEFSIRPLAYAREIFRGEKPQLFALIETELDPSTIETRFQAVAGRREFDRYQFAALDTTGRLTAKARQRLNHEARMNLAMLEEMWLEQRA